MRSLRIWVLPLAALLVTGCQGGASRATTTVVMPPASPSPGPTASQQAPSPTAKPMPVSIRRLQQDLTAAGYPMGGVDGRNGPRTEQGVCAYRAVNGLPGGRQPTSAAERRRLVPARKLDQYVSQTKLPARARSMTRGIVVDQTCQVGFLILGGRVVKAIPVSTGGHYQFLDQYNGQYEWADSPRGLFNLTWRQPGKVTSNEVQGVMYYPWFFHGGSAVHGEADPSAVPPYPASHGCVRMQMADILFIWKHFKTKDPVLVYGTF